MIVGGLLGYGLIQNADAGKQLKGSMLADVSGNQAAVTAPEKAGSAAKENLEGKVMNAKFGNKPYAVEYDKDGNIAAFTYTGVSGVNKGKKFRYTYNENKKQWVSATGRISDYSNQMNEFTKNYYAQKQTAPQGYVGTQSAVANDSTKTPEEAQAAQGLAASKNGSDTKAGLFRKAMAVDLIAHPEQSLYKSKNVGFYVNDLDRLVDANNQVLPAAKKVKSDLLGNPYLGTINGNSFCSLTRAEENGNQAYLMLITNEDGKVIKYTPGDKLEMRTFDDLAKKLGY